MRFDGRRLLSERVCWRGSKEKEAGNGIESMSHVLRSRGFARTCRIDKSRRSNSGNQKSQKKQRRLRKHWGMKLRSGSKRVEALVGR